MNAMDALLARCREFESCRALTSGSSVETYEQLAVRIYNVGAEFATRGLRRGDRVVIIANNTVEYVASYIGALHRGLVAVPVNPALAVPEIAYILEDSTPACVIAASGSSETAAAAMKLSRSSATLMTFSELAGPAVGTGQPESEQVVPDAAAHIIYTSGTTGRPKGAVITHGNIEWMTTTLVGYFAETSDDSVVCALPLFHAYALFQCLLAPLLAGAHIVLRPAFDARDVLQCFERDKATIFFGVPTMFVMMLEALDDGSTFDLSSLRLVVSGGASIPVEVLERWREVTGVPICEGYGLSEVSVMCVCNVPGSARPGSIGLPLPGIDIRVVAGDGGQDHTGELHVRGPSTMKEYWHRPEETAEALVDGWLRTGDIVRQEDDGYLYVVDRSKDVFQRGGYNVYPREVEEVLLQHPRVREVAVVGVPDPRYGEEGVAFIVPSVPGAAPDVAELVEFGRARLAGYKVPRRIHFTDSLPKGPTGKVLKRDLRANAAQASLR